MKIKTIEKITSLPMLYWKQEKHSKEAQYASSSINVSAGSWSGHKELFDHPLFASLKKLDTHRRRPKRTRWSQQQLIMGAVLMAFDSSAALKDRFANARQCLVEMFPAQRRPGKSYQGFVKALRQISLEMRAQLQRHFQQNHRQVANRHWRRFGWIPFAADGSRVEVPRTGANEDVLKCAGRKKTGPQFQLTTIYHMSTGLPWDWCTGPGTDPERNHLRSMLKSLPEGSLLVADAGFTGYELFSVILAHKLSFLIRVGSNVTLLTDLGLEFEKHGNIVWLWPQSKRNQEPLKLRLIRLKVKKKYSRYREEIYLLSNVFDRERLSDEIAGEFYKMRWGVEVFYRSFKQTLNQRKLRSRSPELAQEELHWSLTALLLLGLMGVDALISHRHDPLSLSVAGALRQVRCAMRTYRRWRFRGDLRVQLVNAVKDTYKRRSSKKARDWPHKKKESPPGAPKIRPAKPGEILCAERIYNAA
jgi:Transposase DDE domain